jgi:DNA adenine methylase
MNVKKLPMPFRYPGGKFYALNILAPYWLIGHDEYREPFVGGGSVFFTKPKAQFNTLNDADKELITTYQVIKDANKRLILLEMLEKEVATKERWREIFNFQPKNDIEIAYKYYYLNRTSFSGKLSSPAWGYRDKRSLPPERWHERILPCGEKLQNVDIFSGDFANIIEHLKRNITALVLIMKTIYVWLIC